MAAGEDVAQLTGRRGIAEILELDAQILVARRHRREQAIGIARGKIPADFGIAGTDQYRPAAPPRLGLAEHGLQLVMAAVEIERLVLRPDAIDDIEPLFRIVVATVAIAERHAHHAELDRIPARDDVEPEPAVTDMVRRHHLLGGEHRIDEGDVERAERRDVAGRGEQPAGPGDGFERGALGVALP